ncbi:GAD-like domain-containing protein [Stenotrophomonas sp.]|uniref:GAD-like domain-containing protein n=1 Tax=Stenotrophomonas sp. TaxID=69392 RepID=UPI0031D6E2CB
MHVFGEFQQPYSAPVCSDDPDAGVFDATVEVSLGSLRDDAQVIILDDDSGDAPQRYLVLDQAWCDFPAGTVLSVLGDTAIAVSCDEPSPERSRAEAMLTFLDYLPLRLDGVERAEAQGSANDAFLREFIASSTGEIVPEATLAAWEGVLPDLLLALWRRDGFARYRGDRLALIDPGRYAAITAAFLDGHPLLDRDQFHAYAVTAFGQILICGATTSIHISVDPHSGQVSADAAPPIPRSAAARNLELECLLDALDGPYLDATDDDEQPLYERAYERLGPLASNEIYSFSPSVAEAGWNAAHLVKRDRLTELQTLAARVNE